MEKTFGSKKAIKMSRQIYEIGYSKKKVIEFSGQNFTRGAVHVCSGREVIAVGAANEK